MIVFSSTNGWIYTAEKLTSQTLLALRLHSKNHYFCYPKYLLIVLLVRRIFIYSFLASANVIVNIKYLKEELYILTKKYKKLNSQDSAK